MVRAQLGGEDAPELVVTKSELELRAGQYIVRFDGKVSDRGCYSADPAGTPHLLTLDGTQGTNAGRTIPCIYQLVGDRLRVCYGFGGTRPTAFVTAPGTKPYLAFYRRKST